MLSVAEYEAFLAEAQVNPRALIESCFKIITKGMGGMAPVSLLKMNGPQLKVDRAIQLARKAGTPPRIITLKARQPGISTLGMSYIFATAFTRPFSQSMVVAHLDESAEKLFAKATFMLEQLPEDFRPRFRPPSRNHMLLESMMCRDGIKDLRSSIMVGTASGQELWRGLTLQTVLLSEFARFPYPRETLLGILQSVPKSPDSLVIVESTAQGMGDTFHQEWCRAEAGESGFTPVFIPWYELPDAVMRVPKDFELTAEESVLQQQYGLKLPQLVWRRFTITTECGGDPELFGQEFPLTPATAFLVTGRPCFPARVLQEMYDAVRPNPPTRGRFTRDNGFVPFAGGEFAVWVPPVPGHDYVLSCDPSEGIQSKDSDPACIQVIDRHTEEQVAEWHGKMPPPELARLCMAIGRWYNTALIAPELQGGHGYSMVEVFKEEFYPRLYVYTRLDKVKGTVSNFLGWETNHRTRTIMIDSMHWSLVNRSFLIRSPECLREAMEFQRHHITGRAQGMGHDDRIIALMIALRVHLESPMLDTGMPPRMNIPGDELGVGVGTQSTREKLPEAGLGRAVWEEVEQQLDKLKSRGRSHWMEYGQPDHPTEMETEGEDWFPPGGYY